MTLILLYSVSRDTVLDDFAVNNLMIIPLYKLLTM